MLTDNHEAFFSPSNNQTIWRYMDFTKFISLLETQKLFFARLDQFEDPYEGTWSNAGIQVLRNQVQIGAFSNNAAEQLINFQDIQRKIMFISCWHANEFESAAMWKLYLNSNEGVAIKTDYNTLAISLESAPLKAGISMVRYIDYDNEVIPFNNIFYPITHKRRSFAHEKELRAIMWTPEAIQDPDKILNSVTVDILPSQLIQSVYVSPTAPRWFGELVDNVARRYSLEVPVIHSDLYNRPVF
ncbi:hypothetical protein [Synechococcus elongatus]|uniref:DUF2971 domain-containing protein n=2 Tax=Synechococcus elongatus TaxID=32046 RepID=Q31Q76_SYNE7|nr:hypothetical protein [Synechococcus elongatus]ABB56793.1 conserved hypothetical protein [Synechococcus elongatus PCC 7942 = FACHB-805]AJD58670.1 hypothetical protein M744_12925 [Synechococcus elongatus UTEX 2973]MBD2588659.1 hypothetical protein [Synechococcus elongatus FACHB-242]MBD2689752.1 hypothetical protein [Synechococcus elongatus FACHB-1061]MBD2708359.1 hypothetical protein [Synechococcus elongatus PCC 7942 = FACHB-805]